MEPEQAAHRLLEELYQINCEMGTQPVVNLTVRADECGITDPEIFLEALSIMREKEWIETPNSRPDGLYTRLTTQGISRMQEY